MSAELIGMRPALVHSPKVRRMVASLRANADFLAWARQVHASGEILARALVATLMQVWATARQLAPGGHLAQATVDQVDALAGMPGFATAMIEAGWLQQRVDGLFFPNFEEYNPPAGSKKAAEPRKPAAAIAGKLSSGFSRFWVAYPKKIAKGAARAAWAKLAPSEALVEEIVAAVERQKKCPQWTRDGGQFIPQPATWLNQQRWEDDPSNAGGTEERIRRTAEEQARRREGPRAATDDIKAILERARVKKEGES